MHARLLSYAGPLGLAALAALAAPAAAQTTINFNSLTGQAQAGGGLSPISSPYFNQGFTLISGSGQFFAIDGSSPTYGDGETSLYSNDAASTLLTKTNGGTFTFNSIDLGHFPFGAAQTQNVDEPIRFIGTLVGGGTIKKTVDYSKGFGYKTFSFIGFTNLTSLTFAPVNGTLGNPYQFDNVGLDQSASAAPEPSQLAGLSVTAFGILGLLLRARRRKSGFAA